MPAEIASLTVRARRSTPAMRMTPADGSMTPPNQIAAAAIAAARSRLGVPYVWGATGPGSFDCSGLTQWSYAHAGISLPRSLVADGNYTFESGVIAAERLLDLMPRPTAIFSCNDEMAAGVIHAAPARGLDIPRDLSIIGFDDTPIAAHVWPPLTTVRWPIASMARSAALKLITDGEAPVAEPSMFRSTLIRRASVAPPRSG